MNKASALTAAVLFISTAAVPLAAQILAQVPAHGEDSFTLALPIACQLGATCFIQNYVDHDVSGKVRDFACGSRSYNGHDGTDIRVPDLAAQKRGVEVLAAALGRVMRVRDGIEDVSVHQAGRAAIAGKECGNGALIAHRNGWTTQYCHLAKGSLRIKPGDAVAMGQPIGLVGLSGDTEFPHVHLTVRHDGTVVDPFAADAATDACNGGHSIWAASQASALVYRPSEIINVGFAGVPVTMELIESGDVTAVTPGAEALVAYVRAIGLQTRDQQTLTIAAPDGSVFADYRSPPLESDKAQAFVTAGRRRTNEAWPPGQYKATYAVTRDGAEVLGRTFVFEVKD